MAVFRGAGQKKYIPEIESESKFMVYQSRPLDWRHKKTDEFPLVLALEQQNY